MSETIGQKLKRSREEKHLSIEQVSAATRIRLHYLEAIERDDLSAIPAVAQARGFLRIYADYLGNSDEFVPVTPLPEPVASVPHVPTDSVEQTVSTTVPEPESFVPAHYTEELPAAPEPVVLEEVVSEELAKPAKRSSTRKTASKKPGPKEEKVRTGRKSTVKKKDDNEPVAEEETSSLDARLIVAQAEFIPNEPRQNIPAEIVESQEEIPQPIPEIESASSERPADAKEGISVWRAWIDSVAAKFKTRVNPPKVEHEADENAEPVYNVQDFNPLPVESNAADLSSDEIFVEIGAQLRRRRELLSLTHQEIERHTRVRALFLKALEDGALDDLPSLVQTRGILVNYATFLDLDVDTILLRFADGLQARHRERQGQKPARRMMTVNTTLPFWRVFGTTDLLFGGGMAIVLTIFAIWGISFVVSTQASVRPQPTAPSISDVLAAGDTPVATSLQEVTLIPAQNTPLAVSQNTTATIETPTFNVNTAVHVILAATERTYLRVTVDGKVKFDGRVEPGSAYPFDAEKQVDVLVGNAAALTVTFNGNNLGLMGNFGEVIDRVYTAQGVSTPTGTPPPTFTPTLYMTPTPSPSPTLTPSITPSPKPGE